MDTGLLTPGSAALGLWLPWESFFFGNPEVRNEQGSSGTVLSLRKFHWLYSLQPSSTEAQDRSWGTMGRLEIRLGNTGEALVLV